MTFEQLKPFYPKEMPTKKGWCLQNCRLGFRIKLGHFASARTAYVIGTKNKTVHSMSVLPKNCSVPVYYDTESSYGHVIVYDKGTYYSDGKKFNPNPAKLLGWDELMDNVRVVTSVQNNFLPTKGYWTLGDMDERVNKLSLFMFETFPKYTSKSAKGPLYGKNLMGSIKEFQKRTGLYPDGNTGPRTYAKLKEYGFKY